MPDQAQLAMLRAALEQEHEHLRAQLAELESGTDASLSFDEGFADSGQVAAEQGEVKVLAGKLREQLDDVERALAKLDDGSYGLCERCHEPIADARLEAMPAARRCINHA
jgi:RNA polymerase-binding transcription factor DksA